MGLFRKTKEILNETRSMLFNGLNISFSGTNTYRNVEKDRALQVAEVKHNLDRISNTVASLPIYVHKDNGDGTSKRIYDHRIEKLLNEEANERLDAFTYKKTKTEDILLYGKSYSYIDKNGTNVKGLYPLEHDSVNPKDYVDKNGMITEREYSYILNSVNVKQNEFNINESTFGEGILKSGNIINLALKQLDVINSNYNNNIGLNGIFKLIKGNKKEVEEFSAELQAKYQGVTNNNKNMTTNVDFEYIPLNNDLSGLGLQENDKLFNENIRKIFNVKNDTDHEFIKYTIQPLLVAFETQWGKDLLTEKEKQDGYYLRFDVSEIEKASWKDRIEGFAKGTQAGIFTLNQSKNGFDLPPVEGGDESLVNFGGEAVPIKQLGEYIKNKNNNKNQEVAKNG